MKCKILMMPLALSACLGPNVDPAFKDVQRYPPPVSKETAIALLRDEPRFSDWAIETRMKCDVFGCIQ